MGELFTSFEEAWSSFLARKEPLESFYDRLPDHDETLAVWLIEGAPRVRAKALAAQASIADLGWLALLPRHFLHVTVHALGVGLPPRAIEQALSAAVASWREVAPFQIEYPLLTCFHEAVVAEAHTTGTEELRRRLGEDVKLHLPHMSLAYFRSAEPPEALRARLLPQRETSLGEQHVDEVKLCLVPISKARILEPWTVAGSVALREQR